MTFICTLLEEPGEGCSVVVVVVIYLSWIQDHVGTRVTELREQVIQILYPFLSLVL